MIFLEGAEAAAIAEQLHLSAVSTRCKLSFATINYELGQLSIKPNYEHPYVGVLMRKLLENCNSPLATKWRNDCLLMQSIETALEVFARKQGLLLELHGDRIVLSPKHSVKLSNEAGEIK